MELTIIYGDEIDINVKATNLLNSNVQFSDIKDVVYALKIDVDDVDDLAVFNKNIASGDIILDPVNEDIIISIKKDDFGDGKMQRNSTYHVVLLFEFGDGIFYEGFDPYMENKLFVAKDKWRG